MPRDIAAVCCYFNPRGYRCRLRNFDQFRRQAEAARIPLVTVELAFGDAPFHLNSYSEVRHIRGGDVMWQKERLLQLGLDLLALDGYEKLIWLDADVIFSDRRWPGRIARALDRFHVVQCFSRATQVYSDGPRRTWSSLLEDRLPPEKRRMITDGLAWAARASTIRRVGLYQHCIVGGGDSAMALAWLRPPTVPENLEFVLSRAQMRLASEEFRRHYLAWARQAGSVTAESVGYVEQYAVALNHGAFVNRRYCDRHRLLCTFDPDSDVRVAESGAFEWASDKPELHHAVEQYFQSRAEDQ